jgi:SAM-dependent methyltransferase
MNGEEYARMHALETDYWWFAGRRRIIGALLDTARRDDTAVRLLDIGCGTGANLPMLRSFVGKEGCVTGIDFSPLALQFARSHPESRNVELMQADALNLPFEDNSFDFVTMFDVLEHLSDDHRALQEVHRVLRPGGAYVWSVPAYKKLWSAHDEALHHFRRYEQAELRQLLRTEGFAVKRLSFAMSLMPPIAWAYRRFVLPFKTMRSQESSKVTEGAVLPGVPPWANRALEGYLHIESRILPKRPIRFGTSLVGVARKG